MTYIFIYALVDPHTLQPCYIGQTNDLAARYRGHLREESNKQKRAWLDTLLSEGQLPYITSLDVATPESADELERYWIWVYRMRGAQLFNSPTPPIYFRAKRTGVRSSYP